MAGRQARRLVRATYGTWPVTNAPPAFAVTVHPLRGQRGNQGHGEGSGPRRMKTCTGRTLSYRLSSLSPA